MKITKPKSFIVKRWSWYRGKGGQTSRLRRENDGDKCCLGFYAVACGVPPDVLTGKGTPEDLEVRLPGLLTRHADNNLLCQSAMSTNDDVTLTDPERESKLRKLFKRIGVKVRFQ